MSMATFTPTASGRSTPLHFRDVVSALHDHPIKECSYLLEWIGKFLQVFTVHLLTVLSQQIQDTMKQYKTETESEAHTVRPAES